MGQNRKYAVYINREWLNKKCAERYGSDTFMHYRFEKGLRENIFRFLSGKGELNAIFFETFIGSDGKKHKSVEFKIVEGRHSGKPLKRLKKKHSR